MADNIELMLLHETLNILRKPISLAVSTAVYMCQSIRLMTCISAWWHYYVTRWFPARN